MRILLKISLVLLLGLLCLAETSCFRRRRRVVVVEQRPVILAPAPGPAVIIVEPRRRGWRRWRR